jgi:hypothetical protein
MSPAYEDATIKDSSVPLKDILVEKYWPLLEKKPWLHQNILDLKPYFSDYLLKNSQYCVHNSD